MEVIPPSNLSLLGRREDGMEKDLILAHDLGTTGNKATLFNRQGELLGSAFQPYNTFYPHIGWAEQNPEDWWDAFKAATVDLLKKSRIDAARIAAISFSGQMMGCVPVDKKGNPLRKGIIWADQRGVEEADFLTEKVGEEEVYHITGHRVSPTYSIEKFLWVRKHEPEVFRETHKILHAKDFLRLRLTGNFLTDYSDASSMNLFDINKKDWSPEILEAVEIPDTVLPELHPSTHVDGEINRDVAFELGLAPGTPVVVGGGDGPCAAVGAGVVAQGDAYNYIGSSSWIALATPQPVYDPERRTFNFYHLDPNMLMPTGTMQSAGGSYQWLRDTLCRTETEEAERQGVSPYELMNQMASKSPPGAKGLIFLPYLMGERSPHWNPSARGVFLGLTLTHDRADMIRAVLEGVSLNLRIILDAFIRQGVEIPTIRVIGGGAKGAFWMQILADIFNRPIERLEFLEEATSLGAAIAGGVGVGLFKDFSAAQELVKVKETYYPNQGTQDIYGKIYEIFTEAYDALIPIYSKQQGIE